MHVPYILLVKKNTVFHYFSVMTLLIFHVFQYLAYHFPPSFASRCKILMQRINESL